MKRALPAAVALLLVLGSCGEEETAPQRAEPSEMAQTGAGGPVSGEMQRFTRAPVMVVDLEGRPLANMLPLATDSPNAFQKRRWPGWAPLVFRAMCGNWRTFATG